MKKPWRYTGGMGRIGKLYRTAPSIPKLIPFPARLYISQPLDFLGNHAPSQIPPPPQRRLLFNPLQPPVRNQDRKKRGHPPPHPPPPPPPPPTPTPTKN